MSELGRLVEDGDDVERALLSAAKDPLEDRERERRTLAALGLGGPGVDPGNGGGAPAAAGGASTLAAALKWGALAIAGSAVIVGLSVRKGPSPSAVAPAVTSAAAAPDRIEDPLPSAPPSVVTPPSTASVEAIPQKALKKAAPSASVSARPAPEATELAREIAALDRVRTALAAGDATGAKRHLDQYDHDFPFGALTPEARALRERLRKKTEASPKQ